MTELYFLIIEYSINFLLSPGSTIRSKIGIVRILVGPRTPGPTYSQLTEETFKTSCIRIFTNFTERTSRRWQAPGAVKKEKNPKKIRKEIKKIVPVPIYVFVDSEQKAEFKAKIKPCSHQLNYMKFLL